MASTKTDWAADEQDEGTLSYHHSSRIYHPLGESSSRSQTYTDNIAPLPETTETLGADGITVIVSWKLDEQDRRVKVSCDCQNGSSPQNPVTGGLESVTRRCHQHMPLEDIVLQTESTSSLAGHKTR